MNPEFGHTWGVIQEGVKRVLSLGSQYFNLFFWIQFFIHLVFLIQVRTGDQGFNQGIIESDTLKASNRKHWIVTR
jgi:hypothetical protein